VSLPESSFDRPQGVLVRRPRTSIYTVLLFLSLAALVAGCLIMAWEMLQYDVQYEPPANLRRAAISVATPYHFV
jgi:hypothetical protein